MSNLNAFESPSTTEEAPQLKLGNLKRILTHEGIFHADDTFATAEVLLACSKRFPCYIHIQPVGKNGRIFAEVGEQKIEVIRARGTIQEEGDLVLDCGGEYCWWKWRFDHHQPDFHETWEGGKPMAATGLIHKHFVQPLLYMQCPGEWMTKHSWKLQSICENIDARDNGIFQEGYNISNCVASFIPPWSPDGEPSKQDMNRAFAKALEWALDIIMDIRMSDISTPDTMIKLMGVIVSNEARRRIAEVEAERLLSEKLEALFRESPHAPVLVLDKFIPHANSRAMKSTPKTLKFVVFPGNNGGWVCKSISDREKTGEGMVIKNRCDLPKQWGGLTNQELESVSGIKGAVFCHKNLFLFSCSTFAGAMEAAAEAIHDDDQVAFFADDLGRDIQMPEDPAEDVYPSPTADTRFVILEGIEHGNRFFSSYDENHDHTKSATGELWYRIIGYADTVAEAQTQLYGRPSPLSESTTVVLP